MVKTHSVSTAARINCMVWTARHVCSMYQRAHVFQWNSSSVFAHVCVLASCSGWRLLWDSEKQQSRKYQQSLWQKKLRVSEQDKWCHLQAQLVMEWPENNTEIYSSPRVNLRVWPNDGAKLSTGPAQRNWVWNTRPRSITAPVWIQSEHSNIRQGGLLVLRPHMLKKGNPNLMEISSFWSRKQESETVNQIQAENKYYGFSKGKQHLSAPPYALFDVKLEGVTKWCLWVLRLDLSSEIRVTTIACVWQELYVELHACTSESVGQRHGAWVCISM